MGLDYQSTQLAFREELEKLARLRERIVKRLARVDEQVQAIADAANAFDRAFDVKSSRTPEAPMTPAPTAAAEEPDFEITASIRELLREIDGKMLSAPLIRDELVSKGWKADTYGNPLAVVHQVLNRLIKDGEVAYELDDKASPTKWFYDMRAASERYKREQQERAEARDKEQKQAIARAETRRMLVHPCRKILRSYPKGVSAKKIARELEKIGVDMSCYVQPASVIALVLRDAPDVRRFKVDRDGLIQMYYQLVESTANAAG